MRAYFHNMANKLMAGDKRILGNAPFIANLVQV
jgi:hypothetical protein